MPIQMAHSNSIYTSVPVTTFILTFFLMNIPLFLFPILTFDFFFTEVYDYSDGNILYRILVVTQLIMVLVVNFYL